MNINPVFITKVKFKRLFIMTWGYTFTTGRMLKPTVLKPKSLVW